MKREITPEQIAESAARAWKQELHKVKQSTVDTIPAGFYTTAQLCKMLDLSESSTRDYVAKMELSKGVEMKRFKVATPSGIIRHVPHYRLI